MRYFRNVQKKIKIEKCSTDPQNYVTDAKRDREGTQYSPHENKFWSRACTGVSRDPTEDNRWFPRAIISRKHHSNQFPRTPSLFWFNTQNTPTNICRLFPQTSQSFARVPFSGPTSSSFHPRGYREHPIMSQNPYWTTRVIAQIPAEVSSVSESFPRLENKHSKGSLRPSLPF